MGSSKDGGVDMLGMIESVVRQYAGRVKGTSTCSQLCSMAPTKQASVRQSITLKGSTELVTEFFKYAVNTYVFTTTAHFSG